MRSKKDEALHIEETHTKASTEIEMRVVFCPTTS